MYESTRDSNLGAPIHKINTLRMSPLGQLLDGLRNIGYVWTKIHHMSLTEVIRTIPIDFNKVYQVSFPWRPYAEIYKKKIHPQWLIEINEDSSTDYLQSSTLMIRHPHAIWNMNFSCCNSSTMSLQTQRHFLYTITHAQDTCNLYMMDCCDFLEPHYSE